MSETTAPVAKLTLKQEEFCRLYSSTEEFFANGVQSYLEVYDPDRTKPNWYKTACATASEILSNPKVLDRINELLELRGLNDQFVDKQLEFLVTQNVDFKAKLGALKEYNVLKSRITAKSEQTIIADVTSNQSVDKSDLDLIISALKDSTAKQAE